MINVEEFYENLRQSAQKQGSVSRKAHSIIHVPKSTKNFIATRTKCYYFDSSDKFSREKCNELNLHGCLTENFGLKKVRSFLSELNDEIKKRLTMPFFDETIVYFPSHYSDEAEIEYAVVINQSMSELEINAYSTNEEFCDKIIKSFDAVILPFLKEVIDKSKKYQGKVNLVVATQQGFDKIKSPTKSIIGFPENTDISDLYPTINQEKFKKFFSKDFDGKGGRLFFIHGPPGTGKTSLFKSQWIKDIINEQDVTYINPKTLVQLLQPENVSFAVSNLKNNILFIEDAEEILHSRDINSNSAMSGLLNLTDGIFADIIKPKVVCTFNTSIEKLDKALLRKGRLFHQEEISFLNEPQAKNLIDKLKLELQPANNMSLTEILNFDKDDPECEILKKKKSKIGF